MMSVDKLRTPARKMRWLVSFHLALAVSLGMSACQPLAAPAVQEIATQAALVSGAETPAPAAQGHQAAIEPSALQAATPYPTRPPYPPGELVDYTAQAGDTLEVLARRFNTAVDEILAANTFIPAGATTMPPGMPMKIPIYYKPFWGSPYKILPDSLFINGPAQVGFDTAAFIAEHPGWLNGYLEYAFSGKRSTAQIVDDVALQYSVSPRLLLAVLEYQAGG
jgi:LysM repeat protein